MQLSGRSNDLSKFVKHGCEQSKSFVEVDILNGDRMIVTIRREINSENKGSKWYLDGRPATQGKVKGIVSSLSIDVDNLCSFMPQDKVGSFSRFTPKEILSNTLKSIQEPQAEYSLFEEQIALSRIQDAKEEYRRKKDAKQMQLDTNRRSLEELRVEKNRMERRDEMLQMVKDYEVRLLDVQIRELNEQCRANQEIVDQKSAAVQEEKRRIAPLEQAERDLRRQQATREKAFDAAVAMQRKIDMALNEKSNLLPNMEMDVDRASSDLVLVANNRINAQKKRVEVINSLNSARQDEQTAQELLPNLLLQLELKKAELLSTQEAQTDLDEKRQQLSNLVGKLRDELSTARKELSSLQNFKQIYRAKLSRSSDPVSRDALKALDWLEQHKDDLFQTGQLRGDVLGPVAMHCQVSDPACAMMIEKAIPPNRLMGFVVTCHEDARFISHQFRDVMKLRTDVYTMRNPEISNARDYSPALIEELGLKGYLCDQLECPDLIRSLLYTFNGLHRVLWGRRADNLTVEQQQKLVRASGNFRLYLHDEAAASQSRTGIVEYKGTVSRNPSAPPSTSSIGVFPRGTILSRTGDQDTEQRRETLQRNIREAEMKLQQANQDFHLQQKEVDRMNTKIQDLKRGISELNKGLRTPEVKKRVVREIERALDDLDQQLSVGIVEERKEKEVIYRASVQQLLSVIGEVANLVRKSNQNRVERDVADALKGKLIASIRDAATAIAEAKRIIADYMREQVAAEKALSTLTKKRFEREQELNEVIQQSGLSPEDFARNVYIKILERCPETAVEHIIARIGQLNEEVNRIDDNPLLQKRYEDLERDVNRLEVEVRSATEEFDNAEESLGQRALRWCSLVNKTTDKLNAKFASYMEDLQLAGEVKLKCVGRYEDYEMQLRVSFRDGSEKTDLDGHKHSGGERAVSTAMFLMALQDMTTSPFRVVDEINQGMDEGNERLVFDRVVKSCCGDASKPQYFLVTPKLLQGLTAMRNDDVTILLVWNGPGTGTKWDFSKLMEELRQRVGGIPNNLAAHPTARSTDVKPNFDRRRQRLDESDDDEVEIRRGNPSKKQRN